MREKHKPWNPIKPQKIGLKAEYEKLAGIAKERNENPTVNPKAIRKDIKGFFKFICPLTVLAIGLLTDKRFA